MRGDLPDKIVVLVDTDGKSVASTLEAYRDIAHVGEESGPMIMVRAAKWHLEAWFFADEQGLRHYLRRSLGKINPSSPEGIQNPKLHLKTLLSPRIYTRFVAGEIAGALSPAAVRSRSRTFAGFEAAVKNGSSGHSRQPDGEFSVSTYDIMKDDIGLFDSGVPDLASNPRHMEGFGQE